MNVVHCVKLHRVEESMETYVNVIRKIQKFLPVTDVTLEVNRFAFALMDDPETSGIDFQNGPLKGYEDVNAAVSDQQHGKCLLCGNDIDHFHHIVPQSQGGSNTLKTSPDCVNAITGRYIPVWKQKHGLRN